MGWGGNVVGRFVLFFTTKAIAGGATMLCTCFFVWCFGLFHKGVVCALMCCSLICVDVV